MLLRPTKRIDELLVQILGSQGPSNALSLQVEIASKYRPTSIQGIYHELRKLQADGVVLKVGDLYHLSISWAASLMDFADSVYESYIGSASALAILPEANSSNTWRFTNLLRLDDFWVQIYQTLLSETKSSRIFAWIPHPWYYFAQPDKVEVYYRYLLKNKITLHYIIGGQSYLDRRYAQELSKDFFSYSFADPPFPTKESTYLAVISPYVLTIVLDARTTEMIKRLFELIASDRDLLYQNISPLFTTPAKLKVTLEHSERRARRLGEKFCDFFGVPRNVS